MNPIMYHDSVTKKWGSVDLYSIMFALPETETIAQKIRILQYLHHHPQNTIHTHAKFYS
jgi:hypothetical protein